MHIKGKAITEGDVVLGLAIDITGGPPAAALSQTTPVDVSINGVRYAGMLVIKPEKGDKPGREAHAEDPRERKPLPREQTPK